MTDEIAITEPSTGHRGRGRPSYESHDAHLCTQLVQMWKAGEARSIEAAAKGNVDPCSRIRKQRRQGRSHREACSRPPPIAPLNKIGNWLSKI
jgi:hypothetical protein